MHSLCALKIESEISPLKNCFNVGSVTKKLRIWNFDGLRTSIFYQFGEWKFPKPPYEVSCVGRLVDSNHNRPRTPVQLEYNFNYIQAAQVLEVLKSPEDSTSQNRKEVRSVKQFELYSLSIFPKRNIYIFLFFSVIKTSEKSCLESFIKSEPHDSVLAETYINAINCSFKCRC